MRPEVLSHACIEVSTAHIAPTRGLHGRKDDQPIARASPLPAAGRRGCGSRHVIEGIRRRAAKHKRSGQFPRWRVIVY